MKRDSLQGFAFMLAVCAGLAGCATGQRVQTSWKGRTPPVFAATESVLGAGEPMRLTVVLGCAVTFSEDIDRQRHVNRAEWTRACIAEDQALVEGAFLKRFEGRANFQLIERPALKKVYEELSSSAAADISDNTRLRIWSLTNATHMVVVNVTRSYGVLIWTSRLVELESGRLLASQSTRRTLLPP